MQTQNLDADLVSFTTTLLAGQSPQFALHRDGKLISSLHRLIVVESELDDQDMSHYAGGGLDCERPVPSGADD